VKAVVRNCKNATSFSHPWLTPIFPTLIGLFSILALAIATVGVAGVLAFSVSQRTNELGIRVALGAQRKSILFMILGEGAVMAAIGLGLGGIAAIPLSQLISGLLFDVQPVDPPTIVFAAFLLVKDMMNHEERLNRIDAEIEKHNEAIRGLIVVGRTCLDSIQSMRNVHEKDYEALFVADAVTTEKLNILIDTVDRINAEPGSEGAVCRDGGVEALQSRNSITSSIFVRASSVETVTLRAVRITSARQISGDRTSTSNRRGTRFILSPAALRSGSQCS